MSLTLMPMPLRIGADQRSTARAPTKRRYDRGAAMAYAKAFWDRHCSDGYVAVKKRGTPPYREVEPGEQFLDAGVDGKEAAIHATEGQIPWADLDDCAHFVSCCVGRPYDTTQIRPMLQTNPGLKPADAPRVPAGGLNVRSTEGVGSQWVYGIVGAPRLVSFLGQPAIGTVTARRLPALDPRLEAAVDLLQRGDVIAMANERDYTHVVLYNGDRGVLCHTRCRDSEHWRMNTLAYYTCIHIHDEIPGP